MNKFTYLAGVFSFLLSAFSGYGQESAFSKEEAKALVIKNAAQAGLSIKDIEQALVSDAYFNSYAGTKMVYLQQAYKGVPVYNTIKVLAFKNEKVVSSAGKFIGKIDFKVNLADAQPVITANTAVAGAALNVDRPITQNIIPISTDNTSGKIIFPGYGSSKENIIAKLIWIPGKDEQLKLSWQVKFQPVNSSDYWLINVDAQTDDVINKDNLTVYEKFESKHEGSDEIINVKGITEGKGGNGTSAVNSATYRIIPFPAESMNHNGGTPVLVNNPWQNAGPNNAATTLGWHYDGTAYHDSTRGNNVWAREDRANTNGSPNPGKAAVSSTPQPDLNFDFAYDSLSQPTSVTNQKFALTQLFYWNNIMHDLTYQYGFDEVAGNFQNSNQGRGGLGSDYVIADAQDGSGTNNANFATDVDGTNPRMQMYLFGSLLKINAPASISGSKSGIEGNVSNANKLSVIGTVRGNIVLYGTATSNNGCTALTGTPLTGKLVLINEGVCTYPVKIKNAQLAGAIGVIVMKNSGSPTTMTGTDNTITIPAVMTSSTDGAAIKSAISTGQTVNGSLTNVKIDGDLDNGVMAHEYTHGISNRLTGGPSNASCLVNGEQMGEGWSDYFALLATTDWQTAQLSDGASAHSIGTFVLGEAPAGAGIRTYPYSTNMSINPWTYGMLATNTGGETHSIGEIWSTVLWDMTWDLIQLKGINRNIYNASGVGGNSIAFKLVTEGMRLQACRPGFLDGRDGILKADSILYGGQYSCLIWKAFARRGMGIFAKQGSSDDYTDQTADYNVPAGFVKKTVDKGIADQNEILTYTLSTNCKCQPMTGFKIVDTLDANVTYVSGGTYNPVDRSVVFNVPPLTEGQNQSFTLQVRVNVGTYTPALQLLNEQVLTPLMPPTFTAVNSGAGSWSVSSTRSHSAANSFKAVDATTTSKQTLTSTAAYPVTGLGTLSFWHYFDTEDSYDGGVVEISPDNGATWIDAGRYMVQNGYNNIVGSDSRQGFSGTSGGQFIRTIVNLSAFKNKTIKIRFVFTSDQYVGADGWYIDDIEIKSESGVYNVAKLFNASNQAQSASDTNTFITANLPLHWGKFTVEKDGNKGLLKWSTLQEQNTSEFIIERALNSSEFEKIGVVKAAGNSSSVRNYNFIDYKLMRGVNYYGIRQTDKDGRYTYSEVKSLNFNEDTEITISPNPAKNIIVVSVPGNRKLTTAVIYNTAASKVGTYVLKGESNRIDLKGISSGVYFIHIIGETGTTIKKLLVD